MKAAKINPQKGYFELGKFYLESDFKKPEEARAYKILLKAVNCGSAEACLSIADMLGQGKGILTAQKDTIDEWRSLARTFQEE